MSISSRGKNLTLHFCAALVGFVCSDNSQKILPSIYIPDIPKDYQASIVPKGSRF